jgi:hypothetical protein
VTVLPVVVVLALLVQTRQLMSVRLVVRALQPALQAHQLLMPVVAAVVVTTALVAVAVEAVAVAPVGTAQQMGQTVRSIVVAVVVVATEMLPAVTIKVATAVQA